MDFLLLGILGIIVGFSWIKSAKKEKDIPFVYAYKGIAGIISGTVLILMGIIKIFDL